MKIIINDKFQAIEHLHYLFIIYFSFGFASFRMPNHKVMQARFPAVFGVRLLTSSLRARHAGSQNGWKLSLNLVELLLFLCVCVRLSIKNVFYIVQLKIVYIMLKHFQNSLVTNVILIIIAIITAFVIVVIIITTTNVVPGH